MTKSSNVVGFLASLSIVAIHPLLGLPALIGNLGGGLTARYGYDLINPKLQEYWYSNKGVFDDDIQNTLLVAINKALDRIVQQTDGDQREMQVFLTDLQELIAQQIQDLDVQNLLKASPTKQLPNLLNEVQTNLAIAIGDYQDSEHFLTLFQQNFVGYIQEAFQTEIKTNEKAKAALELLFYESAMNSFDALGEGQLTLLKKIDEQALQTYAYGETWKQAIGRFEVDFAEIKVQNEQGLAKLDALLQDNIELKQLVREITLSPSAQLPNFTASTRFQFLQAQLETIHIEEQALQQAIEELNEAISQEEKALTRKILEKSLAELNTKNIQLSQTKAKTNEDLKNFIKDVLQLANTLSKDQLLQTERIKQARALFLQGKLAEMDALLAEETLEAEAQEAKDKLKTVAQEYTIKAQSANIQKAEGWFEETIRLYKKAFETQENYDTCFNLAYFLEEHNQYQEVEFYYLRALEHTQDTVQSTNILNNLANLHRAKNELAKAEAAYNEALKIYRELAEINPQAFELPLAETCINLGIFYLQNKVDKVLSIQYAKECLGLCEGYLGRVYRAGQYVDAAKQVLDAWKA